MRTFRTTPGCAAVARTRDEAPFGLAPAGRGVLGLEHPGPWTSDALASPGLPGPVADRLRDLGRLAGLRPHLIRRRPVSGRAGHGPRQLLLANTEPGRHWTERIWFDDPAELLDVDLDRAAGDGPPGLGEPVAERQYWTCAHGKHDPCCARLGVSVSRAVEELVGDRAWQASHLGGCRFAATVVALPHGFYLGNLDPTTAVEAVRAYEGGHLVAAHLRGRTGQTQAVSAAEALLRHRHDLTGVDDLIAVGAGSGQTPDGPVDVRFETPDGATVRARVRREHDLPPRHATCGSALPEAVDRWHLSTPT